MNPIVVAVDFSNTSIHAIEYAIPLANRFKSDLVMVWVDKINTVESLYPDTSVESRNEAKKRFEELLKFFHKKLGKEIKMEYRFRKGKVYHEIDHLARQAGAMLIITGTHGISGFEEYWIGSNAFKILTYATCPVITVRHDFPVKKGIERILVPIDNSPETVQKLPMVVRLASLFRPEIHLITTHSSHLKSIQRISEKYAQIAMEYFGRQDIKYIQDEIVSNDITKALIAYARDVEADLISIMTEQETPVNMLLGPYAHQIIHQSSIPVLSQHPAEHFML